MNMRNWATSLGIGIHLQIYLAGNFETSQPLHVICSRRRWTFVVDSAKDVHSVVPIEVEEIAE